MGKPTLLIVGDSWGCGEWQHDGNHQLVLSHPGIEQYLGHRFKVVNLSRGYASHWQTCYALWNYLDNRVSDSSIDILVLQTDAYRHVMHERYHVDLDQVYSTATSLHHFYEQLVELFYIKLDGIAKQYNVTVNLSGGVTDINLDLLSMYKNIRPICQSWIKLLAPSHVPSMIPMRMDPNFFVEAKRRNRYDLCDQISDHSDQHFLKLQEMLETDLYGPAHGDFHPSRIGHQIFANHILDCL